MSFNRPLVVLISSHRNLRRLFTLLSPTAAPYILSISFSSYCTPVLHTHVNTLSNILPSASTLTS
jgi:hypothetical protein